MSKKPIKRMNLKGLCERLDEIHDQLTDAQGARPLVRHGGMRAGSSTRPAALLRALRRAALPSVVGLSILLLVFVSEHVVST